jgi:hypothetical protein
MTSRIRRLFIAAGVGFALVGVPSQAMADPDDPAEAPQPGQVTAAATCAAGKATITVTLDFEDSPRKVRLDRTSPDQATLTKTTAPDEQDDQVQKVVFDAVPAGEYNVHVERTQPDDVPVVVKPCGNPLPADEPLRVNVECQAGWGLVTFTMTNPNTKDVIEYSLTTGYITARTVEVGAGQFLEITENGIEDRTYTAGLTVDGKVVAKTKYTVSCREGNPARLTATTTCPGSVVVNVLNPNRVPVNYAVMLGDATKKLTLQGGEKGSVTFAEIATGEHPVLVKGDDKTKAEGRAKLDCGTPTTTTPTTETPVPQGRSDSGLANTGAPTSVLAGLGMLALALGGALFMIGRRRVRRST